MRMLFRNLLEKEINKPTKIKGGVIGCIDSFETNIIKGWVKNIDSDESLRIDVHINGERVSQGVVASAYREDLHQAGYASGCYGFDIEVSCSSEFENEGCTVVVTSTNSDIPLISKYFSSNTSDHLDHSESSPTEAKNQEWFGNIDGCIERRIFGWITNQAIESNSTYDLFFNEKCVYSGFTATRFREDVKDAGIGDGFCGFDISIDSAPHFEADEINVSIRLSNSDEDLFSKVVANKEFKDQFQLVIDKIDASLIRGWFVNKNRRREIFNVELFIDDVKFSQLENNLSRRDLLNKGISGGFGGFSIKNPLIYMPKKKYNIKFRFPNGNFSSNYVFDNEEYNSHSFVNLEKRNFRRNVSVIVPIFNAPEDVQTCIERLLTFTPEHVKILLINDRSTDPLVDIVLNNYADNERLKIVHNDENLGFTRTVNHGIELCADDDVILLNSDARVTPNWVEGLLIAAASAPDVATVTAMSDRAGAFSAPTIGNENILPLEVDEISYSRSFRRHSLGLYPKVPTGNGFCMYIARDALRVLGKLDADAFPRGYGEENDFCMRAFRAGWSNIIDDRTYVFHERSKSFGEAKNELLAAGRAVIDRRYPEYKDAIRVFHNDESILVARYRAALALNACIDSPKVLPRILFVVATQSGGTPQTNSDLMRGLWGAVETFLLRCDGTTMEILCAHKDGLAPIYTHRLTQSLEPLSHRSSEYDRVILNWLFDLDIDVLHIRHLAWHSLSLPDLAKSLNKKVVFSFHDFYAISPTVKCIDDTGIFMGNTFYDEGSVYRENLWHGRNLPPPTGAWLTAWQERFADVFTYCDFFVTTSVSARSLLLSHFNQLDPIKFRVVPHGRDFKEFMSLASTPVHGEPLRILVPGNISVAKGLQVILDLIQQDEAGLLEFHVLGKTQFHHPRIVYHGTYTRSDFAEKAAKIKPHIGGVFSIWDETYCHTLTELWSIGVPAIVFDFPTLRSRMDDAGCGWVMPHENVAELYLNILTAAFSRKEQERVAKAIRRWQSGYGSVNSVSLMASHYLEIYSMVLHPSDFGNDTARTRVAVCAQTINESEMSTLCNTFVNNLKSGHLYININPNNIIESIYINNVNLYIIDGSSLPFTIMDAFRKEAQDKCVKYIMLFSGEVPQMFHVSNSQGQSPFNAAASEILKNASHVICQNSTQVDEVGGINDNVSLLGSVDLDALIEQLVD